MFLVFRACSVRVCQSLWSPQRNMASTFLSVCLLFISLCCTDGHLHYMAYRCEFNSTKLNDIEYIESYYYNKLELMRFSSSEDKYVGYTEFGVKQAEGFNKDPSRLNRARAKKATICQHNIGNWYQAILSKSVEPSVDLHTETPSSSGHPAMLVCSAYDFYPKQIQVYWLRDGKRVTSGVTSTDEMADGDWYYQIQSHLEYTPRSGEKIQCVVEHKSLKKPLYTDWDPSMPESEKSKIAIGASGLVLGIILSLAGFIYYKSKTRRASGRTLVPTQ